MDSYPPPPPSLPPLSGMQMIPQPPAQLPHYQPPDQNTKHLWALSVCHYVLAGITAILGFLPLVQIGLGLLMISAKKLTPSGWTYVGPDAGESFLISGGAIFLLMEALAVMMLLSGRWIEATKKLRFCRAVAVIECLLMPLGTILGILTLSVIRRPSVQVLFEENRRRWN